MSDSEADVADVEDTSRDVETVADAQDAPEAEAAAPEPAPAPTAAPAPAGPKGIDISDLVAPIAPDEPCGPDLDLEGDADFMNYMARAEGLVPASFFSFDRASVDLPAEIAAGMALAARTHNIQLSTLLAKFSILNRDLKGFARHVAAVAALLETWWDEVHPRPFEGDHTLRMGAAQSLDDPAPSVLPLQHAPLVRHGRLGPIAFRAQLVAAGDVQPREGEEHPDAGSIERALNEVDLEQLVESRDLVGSIVASLARIREVAVDRAGYEAAPKFERLAPLADKMFEWLDGHVAQRDPSRALAAAGGGEAGEGEAVAVAPGDVATVRQAAAALTGIETYFQTTEPSNPALLLIRQARQLVGKSFIDAVRILAPGFVDQAAINIGRLDTFALPLERLQEFATVEENYDYAEPEPTPTVSNRPEAIALIAAVIAFYARVEPSSPVPFLLERARALAGRDFLAILKDILPENTLRNPNSGV
ncbi:MAG: type VI secretion system ImpA family N-terminal domain-containing protein [Methylobacteriaceae bacterium]|nr:type VI secretion system ImpA family N-terminal domain-containing protein [Methylobacteriaceae bacterium]